MKRRKKIYLYMTALLLFIYIVLVMLLYFSEYSDSSATIRTFSDAFWYSLVTLTTVGYGDLTPVTPLGHGVGVVFLFLVGRNDGDFVRRRHFLRTKRRSAVPHARLPAEEELVLFC